MMGILFSGYDLKKGFCLKRNFIYKIREIVLKDVYYNYRVVLKRCY